MKLKIDKPEEEVVKIRLNDTLGEEISLIAEKGGESYAIA